MDVSTFDWMDLLVKIFATSGLAAWAAAFISNKRGGNKVLDFVMDLIEVVAGNVNKAKNDPNV